mmetsp:Transcript_7569/g.19411  ORF Transcript_7569/g.19411 Transcript_7569/m.19411 type:complete len:393 (-) Transcript_7569:150-1328(-)
MRKRGVGAAWSRGLAKRGGNISRSRWIVVGVLLFTLLYFYNVWRLAFLSEDYRQEAWFLRKSGPQAEDAFPGPIPAPPTIPLTIASKNWRGSQWEEDRMDRVEESCSRGASLSSGLDTLCSARNFFHVVVPVRMNDYHALRSAVTSITRQDYPTDKFRIWLVDDSSNHPETLLALSELCSANKVSSIDEYDEVHRLLASGEDTIAAPFADLVWCLRLPNRLGPGSSKYMGFRLVESVAEPHEVVLVVDGDDMLSSAKALEVINKKYMDESVQCTYGSYRGKYGGKYGHPLSFKASLLPHMAREDFTDADGSWLQEASDIGFNDRILGLCGLDSVEYIPETIYQGSAELRLKWDTLFGVWQWGLVVILLSLLCLAAYAKQRPLGGFRYRYFRW